MLCTDSISKSIMGKTDVGLAAVEWNNGSYRKIFKISQELRVAELSWIVGKLASGGNVQKKAHLSS